MPTPRIAVTPEPTDYFRAAIEAGGGTVVGIDEDPTGLVVDFGADKQGLGTLLDERPGIGWVQLPSAGIEAYAPALRAHPDLTWTSAKGAYARPVAEHALALTLALLRDLPERVRAVSWGPNSGTALYGLHVLILGAGGVGLEILRLMKAFGATVTVVRRQDLPVPGADQTLPAGQLAAALPKADIVVVAAALTGETEKLLGEAELAAMRPGSWLVNIARGGLVDTDALVNALAEGHLAGVGLDVTDPEPLPDGHPLWSEPRCLVTPHTADTREMVVPLISNRVAENVRRLGAGEDLEGLVDAAAGY